MSFLRILPLFTLSLLAISCAPQIRFKNSGTESVKDANLFGTASSNVQFEFDGAKVDITGLKNGQTTSWISAEAAAKHHWHILTNGAEYKHGGAAHTEEEAAFTLERGKRYEIDIKTGLEAAKAGDKDELAKGKPVETTQLF